MKCIQYYGKNRYARTSNERAEALVVDGTARFVSKSQWRAHGGAYEEPLHSIGKTSIHPPLGWVNTSNRKPRWAK